MRIALIDDGVNNEFFPIGALENSLKVDANFQVRDRAPTLKNSHGTVCAAIIKKYAPKATLCSIKILSTFAAKGNAASLVAALNWCLCNDIDIVNLSVGTTNYFDFQAIEAAVNKLIEKGVILVSACNNRNLFAYPACLPLVIKVKHSTSCKDDECVFADGNYFDLCVFSSSVHTLQQSDGTEYVSPLGNSFATPVVTALIHNLMEETLHRKLQDLTGMLSASSKSGGQKFHSLLCGMPFHTTGAMLMGDLPLREKLFFRQYSAEQMLSSRFHSIVFVPDGNTFTETFLMQKMEELRCGIDYLLYAGIMSDELRKVCADRAIPFVWDESQISYSRLSGEGKLRSAEITVPVVRLCGESRKTILLLKELESVFRDHDYVSIPISDIEYSYLYDVWFLPSGANTGEAFEKAEYERNCDLILFGSSDAKSTFGFDYTVFIDGEEAVSGDNCTHVRTQCGPDYTKEALRIFSKIEAYFIHTD